MRLHNYLIKPMLLIGTLLLIAASAKSETYVKSKNRMMYAVSNSYIWTIEEGGKTFYYDNQKVKTKAPDISDAKRVSAYSNSLYCVTQQGEILIVTAGSEEASHYPITADLDIRQIEAADGILYILAAEQGSADFQVYAADPYGIRFYFPLSIDGWENSNISSIAYYNGYLCAYSSKAGRLALISFLEDTNGKLVYPTVTVDDLQYVQVGETAGDIIHIYALNDPSKQIQLWDINALTGEKISAGLPFPENAMGLRRNRNALFVLGDEGKELYEIPIHTQNESRTLTLKNFIGEVSSPDPRLKKAMELFYQKYPDVELVSDFITDVRVLSAGVMAGAPGYDVITVQENWTNIPSILMFKAGALENLYDYECVKEKAEKISDIITPLVIDGQLVSVPDTIIPFTWSIDTELEQRLDISVPRDGWSWDMFFDLAAKIKEYNETNKTNYYLIHDNQDVLPYFLKMYNDNYVDAYNGTAAYNSEEFVRLLEKWVEICKDNLVLFRTDDGSNNALLHVKLLPYEETREDITLLLPPVFEEGNRYPARIASICLNSNSPMKEEGAYFLSCWISEEALSSYVTISNNGYLLDSAAVSSNALEGNQGVWQYMLKHTVNDYYIGDLYKDQWQTLYPQLINGKITPLQYAQTCQRRAEMVLGE